jgi:exosortase F-associated protein
MVLLLILVAVRLFEKHLFNDGLIHFFEYEYLQSSLPNISISHILLIDSVRFWFNSLLSIVILYLFFKQTKLLRFLWIFYGVFFIILAGILYYILNNYEAGNYLGLFYIRRILIQPIILFVLFPALLYQKNYPKINLDSFI